jgi:hypothetical protein
LLIDFHGEPADDAGYARNSEDRETPMHLELGEYISGE